MIVLFVSHSRDSFFSIIRLVWIYPDFFGVTDFGGRSKLALKKTRALVYLVLLLLNL